MGAKQSKRSVDISGKEAEGGEVAAAGAGGEGRVEALADQDALKPQLNGDAPHILEPSEKEKQLDIATPENEKDATTEKNEKEQDNETAKEKEAPAPVTNGEAETKPENGESAPTPEEGKKPKKEKVKKKWSLRSISFSRKDKPKQEKKQKEEEAKTNGEPEKLPEEAAEATPEVAAAEVAEEAKSAEETKDEKTPETPVTEPLTNGSSSPEASPPAAPAPAEPATPKPEDLPLNGLSLESQQPDAPKPEESKPEEPTSEPEPVPAPEIPVKKEVCVDTPLESPPPPLPASPPPSVVASFAASTMAPELAAASLDTATTLPIPQPDTQPDTPDEIAPTTANDLTNSLPEPRAIPDGTTQTKPREVPDGTTQTKLTPAPMEIDEEEIKETLVEEIETKAELHNEAPVADETPAPVDTELDTKDTQLEEQITEDKLAEGDQPDINIDETSNQLIDEVSEEKSEPTIDDVIPDPEPEMELLDTSEELPPPPPEDDLSIPSDVVEQVIDVDIHQKTEIIQENGDANHISDKTNGIDDEIVNGNSDTEQENIKNKTKTAIDNMLETIECNGNTQGIIEQIVLASDNGVEEPASLVAASSPEAPASPEASPEASPAASLDALPPPPADLPLSQEPIAVSDKLADLIPEVPVVPELNTETLVETSSDVAVAN